MIIGLDLGTTSISAVLFDPERQDLVHCAACPNRSEIPGLPAGHHEHDPGVILELARNLITRLVMDSAISPELVDGLALTGQQHGLLVVDRQLKPLTHLITWRDQRTAPAPELLRRHAYAAETGCFLHPGYGGLTLHHLIRSGSLPSGACKVLSITGFVAAQLCGRLSIDETMAASWGILDVPSRQWHRPLLQQLDTPESLLPEIVPSGRPLGTATGHLAALIPRAVVYSPVGDNQAGFAGVLEPGGNEAVINIGTSAQLSVFCPRYVFSPKLETRPFPGGGFLRVYAALCGGWAYAYVARFFQQVLEQIGRVKLPLNEVFDRMQQYGTTTDSAGLRADTRFAGERNGPRPAGGVDGIGTTNFTPENLVRAVANGIATELAEAAQDMDLEGLQSLLVVGNAAQQNSLLLKALEKQFGLPCRLLGAGSEAALGAARLAARLGTHTSI